MAKTKVQSEKNNLETLAIAECIDMNHCPVATAIDVIGGKWTIIILYHLRGKTLRFGELKREIPKITHKMLTHQLRDLEASRVIYRMI